MKQVGGTLNRLKVMVRAIMAFDPVEQARAKRMLVLVLIGAVIMASIEAWINFIWTPPSDESLKQATAAFNKLLTLIRAIAYPFLIIAGIWSAIKLATSD